jgi:hypothetical protein
VDSSTSVTTPARESSWVTGPAKFHGSAIRHTVPADLVTRATLAVPGQRRLFHLYP